MLNQISVIEGGFWISTCFYRYLDFFSEDLHDWNPTGTSVLDVNYPFPVWFMDGKSGSAILVLANENRKAGYSRQKLTYRIRLSHFVSLTPDPKDFEIATSLNKDCDPLYGFSVWGLYPPKPKSTTAKVFMN